MGTCDLSDKKKLREYFLNRLDPDETALVQFHLLHCAECRQELDRMRVLADDLDPDDEIDEEFVESSWIVRMKPVLRVAAMVAVVALIAFGGYYFSVGRGSDIPTDINPVPIYQSGDSIDQVRKHELDSIRKSQEDSILQRRKDSIMEYRGGLR